MTLMTAGVVSLVELAGTSSLTGRTGLFIPSATLSSWLSSVKTLAQGIVISEGLLISESGTTSPSNPREKLVTGEPRAGAAFQLSVRGGGSPVDPPLSRSSCRYRHRPTAPGFAFPS
jgi:hypothetical protein